MEGDGIATVHSLRKTFAHYMLAAGVQPSVVRFFTGHHSEDALFKYLNVQDANLLIQSLQGAYQQMLGAECKPLQPLGGAPGLAALAPSAVMKATTLPLPGTNALVPPLPPPPGPKVSLALTRWQQLPSVGHNGTSDEPVVMCTVEHPPSPSVSLGQETNDTLGVRVPKRRRSATSTSSNKRSNLSTASYHDDGVGPLAPGGGGGGATSAGSQGAGGYGGAVGNGVASWSSGGHSGSVPASAAAGGGNIGNFGNPAGQVQGQQQQYGYNGGPPNIGGVMVTTAPGATSAGSHGAGGYGGAVGNGVASWSSGGHSGSVPASAAAGGGNIGNFGNPAGQVQGQQQQYGYNGGPPNIGGVMVTTAPGATSAGSHGAGGYGGAVGAIAPWSHYGGSLVPDAGQGSFADFAAHQQYQEFQNYQQFQQYQGYQQFQQYQQYNQQFQQFRQQYPR